MSYKVELNIYDLVHQLEGINKRHYSDSEIARKLGVHRQTVSSIRKGRPEPSIEKLLEFFAAEGMPITIDQLFSVTPTP